MGLYVYVSRVNCPICKDYENTVDFSKLKRFINKYTKSSITFVKIKGDNTTPLTEIHMSLVRLNRFPSLFYIPTFCMDIAYVPSLQLEKLEGQIFGNCESLCNWVINNAKSNIYLDIPTDIFMKSNTLDIELLENRKILNTDDHDLGEYHIFGFI